MAKAQNISHAVMAQRFEPANSLDDFPTPPWATRALIEHVIGVNSVLDSTCLEPACGRGYMAAALRPYFKQTVAADIADYGYGLNQDFLNIDKDVRFDWVITNPPFRLAEDFFHNAFQICDEGVALLVRTVFIEGKGRLERVFSKYPPSMVAQFAERVPMVKGRVDPKASTATGYAWVVWRKPLSDHTRLQWIPPCRKTLECVSDYNPSFLSDENKTQSEMKLKNLNYDLFGN